ncbi:7865_t:CDS:2, partial [Scutellospora calospora]
MSELIRSYTVYKLLSIQWVVNYASNLINISEKSHLSWLTYWIIKKTIFAQFCETYEECVDTISKLKKQKIGTILGPSIETDLSQDGSSYTENDKKFNQITNEYLSCIQTTSKQPNNFAAIKISGLSDPVILKNLTLILNSLNKAFDQFDINQDGILDKLEFRNLFINVFGESETHKIDEFFNKADSNDDGLIDRLNYFKILLDYQNILQLINNNKNLNFFDQNMIKGFNQLLARLEQLCKAARQYNVKLLIDAEQNYFQPAIDYIAIELSSKYNKLPDESNPQGGPIIFNTYQ